MAILSGLVLLQGTFVVFRILFDFLNYVPAAVCIYHSRTVENCRKNNESYNLLGEEVSDTVNTVGTFLEVCNSVLLLLAIFRWEKYQVKNYMKAIIRVGHFWVWFFLCLTFVFSLFLVELAHGKAHGKARGTASITLNAIGTILEVVLVTFLACALNFIARETYESWIASRFPGHMAWQRGCEHLYNGVLVSYFLRHLGLFLYDTALVAMSISEIDGKPKQGGTKDWDSLLLVLNTAFRGSIVKFFFVKLFQGQKPLMVRICETAPTQGWTDLTYENQLPTPICQTLFIF